MRKFRAWDKKFKKLFMVDSIDFENDFIMMSNEVTSTSSNFANCILEQSTGLKDKNGNEIFEGDKAYLDDEIVIVVWDDQDAMFCIEEGNNVRQHFGNINSRWLEIIGNIHEEA